jgi:predicted small lipoprotein YifL
MKRKLVSAMLVLTMTLSLAGCGKKDEAALAEDDTAEVTEQEEVEVLDDSAAFWDQVAEDGRVRSYLSGEWVDPKYGRQRPVAVMIENTKACLPQYGIGNAKVIYECVVEGGITRMMAIFDDYTGLEQIGNVRSSRPYYVYFASEYDAVYMHAGGNPAAFELIDGGLVENLNALKLEGKKGSAATFRTGKTEHTLYTNSEGIDIGLEKMGYDMSLPANYEPHFKFAENGNALENGTDCQAVQMYYYTNKPYWIYNEDDGLYYRYEFNQKQVDATTGKQLTAKNIIIEDVAWWIYQGSEYLGYVLSYNTGTGKYISNGKMIDIVWSKDGDSDITHYYDLATGEEIQLNIGTTWIQACQHDYSDENVYYADKNDFSKAK